MKKQIKNLCLVLALVGLVVCFGSVIPVANGAHTDYSVYRLTNENMLYPSHYYSTLEMTDTPTEHTFVKIASGYPSFGCDGKNNSALCSKPYKFNELYDNYVANGSTGRFVIPCCVIDLALGGDPVEVAGFGMTLRSHGDCRPIHLKIQVATDAAAKNWVTVYDATNIEWESMLQRWYFDPIDAYQIRVIALDIDEVDTAAEGDYYDPIQGDETRFTYAEVYVFTLRDEDATSPSQRPTYKPSQDATAEPTRPAIGIQIPTRTPTQPATQAPTQPATQVPTQPATQSPTQPATQAPTQPATQAPTQPATQAPTQPVTQAPTTDMTTEPTVDPSAPTDSTVDPSAPTEETIDPSAPTDATEPDATEATEPDATEATEPNVTEATEPQETTPDTNNGDGDQGPNYTVIVIIAIIAAAVLLAAGAVLLIVKKKSA